MKDKKSINDNLDLHATGVTWVDDAEENEKIISANLAREKKRNNIKKLLFAIIAVIFTSIVAPIVFYEYKTYREAPNQTPLTPSTIQSQPESQSTNQE